MPESSRSGWNVPTVSGMADDAEDETLTVDDLDVLAIAEADADPMLGIDLYPDPNAEHGSNDPGDAPEVDG